jgi:hypothetical protein
VRPRRFGQKSAPPREVKAFYNPSNNRNKKYVILFGAEDWGTFGPDSYQPTKQKAYDAATEFMRTIS